jgi:RNA polymerase sigma-70 factor (ECF subfamily)
MLHEMAESNPLSRAFFAELDGSETREGAPMEGALVALIDEAIEEHKDFGLEPVVFAAYVAERLTHDDAIETHVSEIRGADLYLACACVNGLEPALKVFHERFGRIVKITLAKLRMGDESNDVQQELLERLLLMRDERPPAIALYAGRGPLHAYLRVAVTREALRMAGRRKKEVPSMDYLIERVAAVEDPETAALKRSYGPIVKSAFQAAVTQLSTRDRRLLRYHYVEDLTTRQIGVLLSVHGSTVTRQLTQTRGRLLVLVRKCLGQLVTLQTGDLESVCKLVESQLDLSLTRLLSETQ